MQKFLSKVKIKVAVIAFVFLLILLGLVTLAGNISLTVNKDTVDQELNGYFKNKISVGSIFYIFPNRFLINDIEVHETEASFGQSSFKLSTVTARFSLVQLLFDGVLNISHVNIYPSTVSYYIVSQFLENNLEKILEIIRNAPGNDIKIRINEILLDFDRKGTPDYVVMELLLNIKNGFLDGAGLFRTDQYQFDPENKKKIKVIESGWPLLYKLRGEIKSDGLDIDHFIVKSENLYAKLWGGVHSGKMKLNGFSFIDTARENMSQESSSITEFIKDFSDGAWLENIDIHVLDIDGNLTFAYPEIEIEHLDFSMNNTPVSIKGGVSFLDVPTLNAEILLEHLGSVDDKNTFFEKTEINIKSVIADGQIRTNGNVELSLLKHEDLSLSPEKARVKFNGLVAQKNEERDVLFNLDRGEVIYWTGGNEHKISIEDLKAHAKDIDKRKVIDIQAPFYQGALSGSVWIDSTQSPVSITSRMELENVDTDALEEFLIHFAKFNGRMSGIINFNNLPELGLKGDVMIRNGVLTNFNFFNWVGDSFKLPSLKSIPFDEATAQFLLDKDHVQLFSILLETDDVHIDGFFDVDHENLVTSKLTVALSQELLSKSSKFKPVLKMFDDDEPRLDFDFRLSGNADTMNFQWMPSLVKEKIQKRIPNFIERRIEQNIDDMMEVEPKSGKNKF